MCSRTSFSQGAESSPAMRGLMRAGVGVEGVAVVRLV